VPVIECICGWSSTGVFGRFYDHISCVEMAEAILLAYRDDPI
jgi:hypothetical protein